MVRHLLVLSAVSGSHIALTGIRTHVLAQNRVAMDATAVFFGSDTRKTLIRRPSRPPLACTTAVYTPNSGEIVSRFEFEGSARFDGFPFFRSHSVFSRTITLGCKTKEPPGFASPPCAPRAPHPVHSMTWLRCMDWLPITITGSFKFVSETYGSTARVGRRLWEKPTTAC